MDENQEMEWMEAQKINISEDLVAAAKRQLRFLAAVDRRRSLYHDGPVLQRAIHRYKACWLPLLAKHTEPGDSKEILVVPLDCEWIWHCHRLNPVQYKKDCEKSYGRILDNQYVESSLEVKSKYQTEEIWTKLYSEEPFELDYSGHCADGTAIMYSESLDTITYDFAAAVKRQSSFYYQVSRSSMHDNRFLEDALARYKCFLHLIKRNQVRSMKHFCVPTYDVDLIWHSHQLQPISYCKDMLELLGKVLEHDDMDSDRSQGKKLDVGFSETTKQWEDAYGLRYWKAGAMYRGSAPSPLMVTADRSNCGTKNTIFSNESQKFLHLPKKVIVEVLLEIIEVKNLPSSQKANLFVTFNKKTDLFFSGSGTLSISSESGEKLLAGFVCEPTGELLLTLGSNSTSKATMSRPAKTIGTTSISLNHLTDPHAKLSIQRWLELKPCFGSAHSMPVYLHVAVSFTVPDPAPFVLNMVKLHPISMSTCLFPQPGKFQPIKSWTRFMDDNGNEIVRLQMRNTEKTKDKKNYTSKMVVVGKTKLSRKPHLLADYAEHKWSLKYSNFFLHIERKVNQDGQTFELSGDRQLKLVHGKKLECEPKNFRERKEDGFLTVVEFSAEHPYGKAVALLNMKSGLVEVNEEWFVLPGILLVFILSNISKKEEYEVLVPSEGKEVVENRNCNAGCDSKCETAVKGGGSDGVRSLYEVTPQASGGCGSGCGGACGGGMAVKSSGCGGGGCGSGCGGDSEMAPKSSGCGGGCGSGCGGACGVNYEMAVKASGCGGGGGCAGAASGNCEMVAEVISNSAHLASPKVSPVGA